jgi:hypothetical protein
LISRPAATPTLRAYQAILFAAAFATVVALSCWFRVRAADTTPVPREIVTANAIVLPVAADRFEQDCITLDKLSIIILDRLGSCR